MSPLLYPILLLLYSEFSTDTDTRLTARMLTYGYFLSLFILTYFDPNSTTIILACIPYLVAYLVIAVRVKNHFIKIPLLILFILQVGNYTSLYYKDFDIMLSIPLYLEYSNIILRELAVTCIAMCTSTWKVDTKLKIGTFTLYVIEYSYISGF